MKQHLPDRLFILEMANNHMGDLNHGMKLIKTYGKICKKYDFNFAIKLQYRDLDTFIHPYMKNRMDVKYIKRFTETKLKKNDFDKLINEIRKQSFLTISTPFDEKSVDIIEKQNLDIIKIASCSSTDWPLLERVVDNDKPIIISNAGNTLDEIDQIVNFLSHRDKEFVIMHCVGEYPTPDKNMHLSQISLLKNRYPNVRVGFSTHENPSNTKFISMAIAMGASVFERHVGLISDKYPINNYSSTPEQIDSWLKTAKATITICGASNFRPPKNLKELNNLKSLRRGVFARNKIKKGEIVSLQDIYFAFPSEKNQFTANDWSKYFSFKALKSIKNNEPINKLNTKCVDQREKVWKIIKQVQNILKKCQTQIPGGVNLEISHHYGLNNFYKFGLVIINIINRKYTKKILLTLPGQSHPEQWHKKKEETFYILYGDLTLNLDGEKQKLKAGDVITIMPGTKHQFYSQKGCVIEEISTTHHDDDSYYTDPKIMKNNQRKTILTYWLE